MVNQFNLHNTAAFKPSNKSTEVSLWKVLKKNCTKVHKNMCTKWTKPEMATPFSPTPCMILPIYNAAFPEHIQMPIPWSSFCRLEGASVLRSRRVHIEWNMSCTSRQRKLLLKLFQINTIQAGVLWVEMFPENNQQVFIRFLSNLSKTTEPCVWNK